MFTAREGIRFLRRLGFVLIALPEAFTTPFGVALLFVARYLSKKIEADLYKRLRHTFRNYLSHYTPRAKSRAQGAKRESVETQSVSPFQQSQQDVKADMERQAVKAKWRFPQYGTISGAKAALSQPEPKARYVPLVWRNRQEAAANTVYHSVDWKKFSSHYGTITGVKIALSQSKPEAKPARNVKLVRHDIDVKKLSRLYRVEDTIEADSASAAIIGEAGVRHSRNTVSIRQRLEAVEPPPSPLRRHTMNRASLIRHYSTHALR